MIKTIFIDRRFCGPPLSGNGGYVCGLLAKQTDFVTEVTLRKPPPLDKPLQLTFIEKEVVHLMDDELLIASARPGSIDYKAPVPPAFEEADHASKRFLGLDGSHPFPTCFVCGPQRKAGDGLRIFAGRLNDGPLFAAPWTPAPSLAEENGEIKTEFIWAALDCPGAFAIMNDQAKTIVLGRMTADIQKQIKAGEKCVVIAWDKGKEGRKFFSGTAIYNEERELCAVADAIWIEIES